jgi:probable phosphoglycerate mutase
VSAIVFLVRHGLTKSNIDGFYMGWSSEDLNEAGYTQARRLSLRLARLPIASIYTSPLRRAYTTAAILNEPHQVELTVMEDLTEVHLGDWQGLHIDEVKQRWPELWQQSRVDPSEITLPDGESVREMAQRSIRAFETVVETNPGKQIVMVTHQYIIRAIVAYTLGASSSIFRKFDIDNASLSAIQVGNGTFRLIMLNDTSHLEGLE